MTDIPRELTVQDSQLAAMWSAVLQGIYEQDIQLAAQEYPDTRSVFVDFRSIELANPDLADYILQRPKHALRVGETALYGIDMIVDPKPRLRLRIRNLPDSARIMLRDLRAEHLDRFVAVEGLAKKVTEVRPQILEAAFECKSCGNLVYLLQEEDLLGEPVMCDACEKSGNIWRMRNEMCRSVDFQKVELQENPEGMQGGRQERLVVYMRDDVVHSIQPGDRVRINGVLDSEIRRQGTQKKVVMNKVLQANSIEPLERAFEDVHITAEDLEWIEELSKREDVIEVFRGSFAPTIFGCDDIKDAMLLALFGGVGKQRSDGSWNRGDFHVLLVGDPSVAKTRLIRFLADLAPRSVFAEGKGASAAGLTAAAVKDSFDGDQYTLEAGAMVLADGGILAVDELDKMSREDASSMHGAMESQQISIAKAGISATMRCRCAVIAAANPKLGRFDRFQGLAEQVKVLPALLSRFALIFLVLDVRDPARDEDIADHILGMHGDNAPMLTTAQVRKYVAHAKRNYAPTLDSGAKEVLKEYYTSLRALDGPAFPITSRQLEDLQRITEAYARMRLSHVAEAQDAKRAVALMSAALKSSGTDPETGTFDVDVITTGVSNSQHDRIRLIQDIVRKLAKQSSKGWARDEDVLEEAKLQGISEEAATKALATLRRNNSTYAKGGSGTHAPMGT